ncbi:hypothetical protein FQN55_006021 [Onygenales sp. PD_40]|nr:hypothetical protein FQN55_006021 [Onygenales sp. PD_40]
MTDKYYPIHGIQEGLGPGDQVPIRREFNEWSKSKERRDQIQVVLFLLALKRFQDVSPDSRDSYFQIAGIHGMPYRSWDEPGLTAQETHRKGYCVHANSLFPLWHRPYLLLYEQRIYEIMVDQIIPELRLSQKDDDEWCEAASKWRLPFWDWAKNPKVPELMGYRKLRFDFPQMTIDNPLYKFKMPNGKKMSVYGVGTLKSPEFEDALEVRARIKYGECYATSRCPAQNEREHTSKEWMDGVVNTETANKFLADHQSITDFDYGRTAEMVYRLLTYPMDFVSFATTARDATAVSASESKVTNDMNIEFIHNNIHYWVGGDGGHMSQIPVATFDPIFWFHHCHVTSDSYLDRLFAIWQTLNPEKWFTADKTRPFDQKVIGMGDIVTSKTPLRPFHNDEQGTVWTPDDTRDWFKLGYTYPELQRWKYDENYKDKLFRDMNESYGVLRKEAQQMAKSGSELPGVVEIKDNGVALNDYAVSIKYSKFAMGGHPFNLEVYLRPENETENTFRPDDIVTNVYNFSQPPEQNGETVCSNCSELEEQDVQVTAYIPITSYLIKKIKQQRLRNLDRVTVENFLSGIYYRVTMTGNTVPEKRWKQTMNLKVAVSRTKMNYSNDPNTPPKFDDPQIIPSLGIGGEDEMKYSNDPNTPPKFDDPQIIPMLGIGGEDTGGPDPTLGVSINHLSFNNIIRLEEAVSAGESLVITSQYVNLDIPHRERSTRISLIYVDPSAGDPNDQDSYDILLHITIWSKRRALECSSKQANYSPSVSTELQLTPWFQKDDPRIRVDVGADEFVLYVDGRRIQAVKRAIKRGNITHVRYCTLPPRAEPVMARDIKVTTYKQTSLVP